MNAQTITIEVAASKRLRDYEAVIEAGLEQFWQVGMALAAIRSERLYRATHETFDAYCLDRWGFSASRARQLILGTSTREYIESVTGVTLSGERETRALRKYDDDLQPLIVETVVNRYGEVTESRIERVGDTYTQLRATGHVDIEGVATPVDAALNQADEEASKRAKEYAANNRDPNRPTYAELLTALECAEYTINRLVSGIPVEMDEGLVVLRQVRAVIERAGGKLS